jgi:hypothetical protein
VQSGTSRTLASRPAGSFAVRPRNHCSPSLREKLNVNAPLPRAACVDIPASSAGEKPKAQLPSSANPPLSATPGPLDHGVNVEVQPWLPQRCGNPSRPRSPPLMLSVSR